MHASIVKISLFISSSSNNAVYRAAVSRAMDDFFVLGSAKALRSYSSTSSFLQRLKRAGDCTGEGSHSNPISRRIAETANGVPRFLPSCSSRCLHQSRRLRRFANSMCAVIYKYVCWCVLHTMKRSTSWNQVKHAAPPVSSVKYFWSTAFSFLSDVIYRVQTRSTSFIRSFVIFCISAIMSPLHAVILLFSNHITYKNTQ
jgi:hypothetical protein